MDVQTYGPTLIIEKLRFKKIQDSSKEIKVAKPNYRLASLLKRRRFKSKKLWLSLGKLHYLHISSSEVIKRKSNQITHKVRFKVI